MKNRIRMSALALSVASLAVAAEMELTVSPSIMAVGETVTVNWNVGTNKLSISTDRIAVFPVDTPDNTHPSKSLRSTTAQKSVSFNYTINTAGIYEARYVKSTVWPYRDWEVIMRSQAVTVTDSGTNPDLPKITVLPNSQSAIEGETVKFTVSTESPTLVSFRWRKDDTELVGETSPELTLNDVKTEDAGTYTVIISNEAGSVVTPRATLSVYGLNTNYQITVPNTNVINREIFSVSWTTGTETPGFSDLIHLCSANTPIENTIKDSLGHVWARTFSRRTSVVLEKPGQYKLVYLRRVGFFPATYTPMAISPIITVTETLTDPNLITNFPSGKPVKIVAFGDSITLGVGYGARPNQSYPDKLKRHLACYIGCIEVIPAGVAGDTTGDALNRLPEILALNPSHVLLAFGGNDILRRIPVEQAVNNLRSIVNQLHADGIIVVLIGIQGGRFTESMAGGYRTVAEETGCAYEPNILHKILDAFSGLRSDSVHPNEIGYEIIAERLLNTVSILAGGPRIGPAEWHPPTPENTPTITLSLSAETGRDYMLMESKDLEIWIPIGRLRVQGEGAVSVEFEIVPRDDQGFYILEDSNSSLK